MEKILTEILNELKYQTKLMEANYQNKDEMNFAKKQMQESLRVLQNQFAKHPMFKQMGGQK